MNSSRKVVVGSVLANPAHEVLLKNTLAKVKKYRTTGLPEIRYAQVISLYRTLSEMAISLYEAWIANDLDELKDKIEDMSSEEADGTVSQGGPDARQRKVGMRKLKKDQDNLERLMILVDELKSEAEALHDGLEDWVTSPLLASLDHIRGQQMMKGAQGDFHERSSQ